MMMHRLISLIAFTVLVLACVGLSSIPEQKDSGLIIGLFSLAFLAYGYLLHAGNKGKIKLGIAIGIGVLIRLILVFFFPNLSNDIYRFIWDGNLIHLGINPLSYTPTQLLSVGDGTLNSQFSELYGLLNSPDYYTIYPPVSQLVYFFGTAWDSSWDSSWEVSGQLMKLVLFMAEVGTVFLLVQILKELGKPLIWAMLYFLNPLVIVEIVGQLHFEGLMVFFLAAGLLLLLKGKNGWAGCMMALSIGTKLLPLMFLPLMLYFLGEKRRIVPFMSFLVFTLAISFLPFFWTLDLGNFLESLNLYFQKFEFNASVYYVLRGVGRFMTGYNQIAIIGPLLSLVTLGAILYISFKDRAITSAQLIEKMFYCFAIYLVFATTVHPWYLCMLVFLAVSNSFRWWAIVWSGVVVWSYTTYASPTFEQNLLLICLEYLVVILAFILQWWLSTGHKKSLN